jgi:hypothetical protein
MREIRRGRKEQLVLPVPRSSRDLTNEATVTRSTLIKPGTEERKQEHSAEGLTLDNVEREADRMVEWEGEGWGMVTYLLTYSWS